MESARRCGWPTNPSRIKFVPQTLSEWGKPAEVDNGMREGVKTSDPQWTKALEREVNEILKLASAFFAQAELDRRPKS